ncbi:hypothetical protein AVEN_149631-1 [Araneus ventricosus]|uniref:Uncharacterized protein n=1 Tax=Araneus ventricosus TaxID=182803 RepID=A0A4Y2UFJ9_ARAVE|nr:hypothetical protein AVEN_149631-1 [Araneus ventricosus]
MACAKAAMAWLVRSRLKGRRVPGSKPGSSEDPSCIGPFARKITLGAKRHPVAVKTEAIWASSEILLPKTRSHRNLKDSYLYPIAEVPFQRAMDRLPAVSDTKASSKCIGTRLAKFRFRGEWNGYWLYQIQKYQVNVSGTNEYQYPHVSDTAKTCINPSLM